MNQNKQKIINYRNIYERYYSLHFERVNPQGKINILRMQAYYFWKKYLLKYMENFDKNKIKVLDIGCGTGRHMFALRKMGYEVEGVDIAKELVQMLLKEDFNVYEGNAVEFLAGKSDAYDIIIAFDIVEHLKKDEAIDLLHAINKSLKSNGMLFLGTFNANNPSTLWSRYSDMTHEIGYTKLSLEALLNICNFKNNKFIFHSVIDFFIWHHNVFVRFFRFLTFKIIELLSIFFYWFISIPAATSRNIEEFKPYLISISRKK